MTRRFQINVMALESEVKLTYTQICFITFNMSLSFMIWWMVFVFSTMVANGVLLTTKVQITTVILESKVNVKGQQNTNSHKASGIQLK